MATTTAQQHSSPLFIKTTKADIIIQSADNVHFYVAQCFLSHASTIFKDMFLVPLPVNVEDGDEIKEGLRIVKLSEESAVLECLLLICHPRSVSFRDVELKDVETAASLLRALHKYEMEDAYEYAWKKLYTSSLVRDEPMRAFAAACRVRCMQMVKFAARYISEEQATGAMREADPNSDSNYSFFTLKDLKRAVKYREECIRVAEAVVSEGSTGKQRRYSCGHQIYPNQPSWMNDYFKMIADAFHENPCGTVVLDLLVELDFGW
ncbi:hypothetical protein FIBSPDRAFT_935156 [Athelia psychrophila]|uniref:BTB domain-containing protein n=1 Tax=Athelia psychrophila TaxID=1759441 RepID=A0A166E6V9_9AGAM|nr:hypothetical protein FIBSPDRAFT_935156 [Fibularhizoctonia sp. CBS 109695]